MFSQQETTRSSAGFRNRYNDRSKQCKENNKVVSDDELDKELQRAGKQYDEAYNLVEAAGEKLLSQREKTLQIITDVEGFVNSISCRPKTFETDIRKVSFQKKQYNNTLDYAKTQKKVIKSLVKNVGAGVTAGAAVARMASTAVMWVATTFGTASTGTAISELSGAAATNAALAWLGGGPLAAGGGGMAAGHALLALAGPIGLGVAGTSLVAGVWLAWKKSQKIQESKYDEILRLKKWVEALKEIKRKMDALSAETLDTSKKLQKSLSKCKKMRGCDYTKFSDNQKNELGAIVNNTKALSALLNKTIAG